MTKKIKKPKKPNFLLFRFFRFFLKNLKKFIFIHTLCEELFGETGLERYVDGIMRLDPLEVQLSPHASQVIAGDRCCSVDGRLSASTNHDAIDDVREFERLEADVHRQKNFDVDDELISISEPRSSTQVNSTDDDGTSARFGI